MSREELEATPPLEQHLAEVLAGIIKDKEITFEFTPPK